MINKIGQVAIFVIVAIVIVGALITFFVFKDRMDANEISPELAPVFDFYQSCIGQSTREAIQVAGSQGGYIETPGYVPGSEYSPFSSHLNFLGIPIPYWYYVSGNGLIKEQVPSKAEMESQIEDYVNEGLKNCDFEFFYRQGILVGAGEPEVNVVIEENNVIVDVSADVSAAKGEDGARKTNYDTEISTKLGKFYNLAREIYDEQKEKAFLEEYALDVLYLYAPVDGAELQCGPKIWRTESVMSGLRDGLEENIQTIKFKGEDIDLEKKDSGYFVVDKEVDENVNVLYSEQWPTKIEIVGEGVDEEIMIAESVGTQQGLGAMGFCYVPYHFVYDVSFPVLIQIYDEGEIFQFPVAVIINKNVPREAIFSELSEEDEFNLCQFKNEDILVNIFDTNLRSVDANISYECFSQRCRLGESKNGRFIGRAPLCVNGYLHLRADGFAEKKQLMSTNEERVADVVLDRERSLKINLTVGGQELKGTAIATFVRDDGHIVTSSFPTLEQIKLSEGAYEVKIYVYGNSSVVIPATTKTQCIDAPKKGILGFFGGKKEECFDINIPEMKIDNALIGGGISNTYFLDSELERGGLIMSVDRLPTPNSIDSLQNNFEIFETKSARFEFYDA